MGLCQGVAPASLLGALGAAVPRLQHDCMPMPGFFKIAKAPGPIARGPDYPAALASAQRPPDAVPPLRARSARR